MLVVVVDYFIFLLLWGRYLICEIFRFEPVKLLPVLICTKRIGSSRSIRAFLEFFEVPQFLEKRFFQLKCLYLSTLTIEMNAEENIAE